MYFEKATATLCALGWLLHWLMAWGVARKANKCALLDFLLDDVPAFAVSVVATLAAYLVGPGLLAAVGVDLPGDGETLKLLGAFVVGYMADSLVDKIATLLPRKP